MPSCRRRVRYRSVSPLRGSDGRADDRCAGVHDPGLRPGLPAWSTSGAQERCSMPKRVAPPGLRCSVAPSTQGLRPGLPAWSTSGARRRGRVGERRGSCDQRRGKCHHMGEKINHRRGRIITRAAHAIALPAHVIARAAPRRRTGRGADQNRGAGDQRCRAVDQRRGRCDDKNEKCDHKNGGCDPPRGVDHHVLGPCGPARGAVRGAGPRARDAQCPKKSRRVCSTLKRVAPPGLRRTRADE
jgi:hypothetical protein